MTPAPDLSRRRALRGLAVAAATAASGLAGCSAMQAQNPAGPWRPANVRPDDQGQMLLLGGHDVVAYFTLGRPVPGLAAHSLVHEGVPMRFASAEHLALFRADPQRYFPQFGGYCANGIVYGIPWGGDADTWRILDGKLLIFGGAGSQAAFELDPARNLALAEHYWRTEVQGSHSFVQRSYRLIWRVPHYKSGAELEAMVRAAARPARP